MRSGGRIVLALGVALALAGCAGDDGTEAGFGVPRLPSDAPLPGPRTDVRGTVQVEPDGCLTLDTATATGTGGARWIVWPAGQEDDQGHPVLDGRVVDDGDVLVGTGVELPAGTLPDWWDVDGYFGSFGAFCSVEETGIVVLDDVARG